ncbi:hypothetical protein KDA06_03710 [Candidatus Saccharibacteria bacterium]|nr:hypothetical protein [Candidatus Saccharibacteria bacterium]
MNKMQIGGLIVITLSVLSLTLGSALTRADNENPSTAVEVTSTSEQPKITENASAASRASVDNTSPQVSAKPSSSQKTKFVRCDYTQIPALPNVTVYTTALDEGKTATYNGNEGIKKVCDDGTAEVLLEPTAGEIRVGTYVPPERVPYQSTVTAGSSSACIYPGTLGYSQIATYQNYCGR